MSDDRIAPPYIDSHSLKVELYMLAIPDSVYNAPPLDSAVFFENVESTIANPSVTNNPL